IDVGDFSLAIDGKEARGSMVEVIDRMLKLLEDVLLAFEIARDVGDDPDAHAREALVLAEWAHPHAQPPARLVRAAGDSHLLLQRTAFASGLEQTIDRFRNPGIPDEHALDRSRVAWAGCSRQIEIGPIGKDYPSVRVGDEDALPRTLHDRFDQG